MPLYEYKCTNCGKTSEFILKYGEVPSEGCKYCGEKRLERVLFSTFLVGASGASLSDSCGMQHVCGGSCNHGASSCKFGGEK